MYDLHKFSGCRQCVEQASNTFMMDEAFGTARVKVQYGDDDEKLEVFFRQLFSLHNSKYEQEYLVSLKNLSSRNKMEMILKIYPNIVLQRGFPKPQISVDSCPVNCIHWVEKEELAALEYLIKPQPKVGYGIYGQGWERPANVFKAAKSFNKQSERRDENQQKHGNIIM